MANNKRKKESNFVVQGSILAAAGIISRIIGMVYKIPLTNIIGNEGNGYYSVAQEIYNMALLISSYSLPLAVSKLVAARVGSGEKKNAFRVFKASMLFAAVVGAVTSFLIFFGAEFITGTIMKQSMGVYALQVLTPTIFIFSILGVLRGYFQGIGTMMPTAASQLLEQVVNAVVSVGAAHLLFQYGISEGAKSGNYSTKYAYGAAGGQLGTTIGTTAALLFMVIVFLMYQKVLRKQIRRDITVTTESYGRIYRMLIWTIVPVVLSTAVYNISTTIDQGIFNWTMQGQGVSSSEYASLFGVFTMKYKQLITVPISFASALVSSVIPSLTVAYSQKDEAALSRKINTAIRFTMMVTIPCAVGLAVLAAPIMRLLFRDSDPLAANLMRVGAIAVVFYSLSTLTNGILQGINKMRIPIRNACIALAVHVVALLILLKVFNLGIYAVVLATILFAFTMCVLNSIGIRMHVEYKQEVIKTFAIPVVSSVIMGVIVFLVHTLLNKYIGNAIATVVAILFGASVYGVSLLLLKGVDREELLAVPKGHLLVRIAEKLRLM